MSPREIVEAFADQTARCLDQLKLHYSGPERPTVRSGLFLRTRDGAEVVRSGSLEGMGRFKLHGRGCQFELNSGEDLDVDWDCDGRAVFDSWRILMFARSIGDEAVDQETLRIAAGGARSVIQLADDRFTWATRHYDITWGDL